jgi:hypothetical protein
MNCQRHEEGLLLLAHNAAGTLQRWRLKRHLKVCPECRARYDALQRTSLALAAGIRRDTDLPAWRLPATAVLGLPLPRRVSGAPLALAAAAAAAGLTAAGYQVWRTAFPPTPLACKTPIVATPPPRPAVHDQTPSPAPLRRRLSRVVP